jgi:hypothetical protein
MDSVTTGLPIFNISIDTELIWGVLHHPDDAAYRAMNSNPDKTRDVFNRLLEIFDRYDTPVTWAIVGHMFLDKCEGHNHLPSPEPGWYSKDPGGNLNSYPLFYGRDIIENILSRKSIHEVAYHSFSHPDFTHCSREVAEAEIKEGVKIADDLGIKLDSFVFPKNGIVHIDLLIKYGFKIYRGKNLQKWDVNQPLLQKKINGLVDKFITTPVDGVWRNGIWELPSSMSLFETQVPFTLPIRLSNGIGKSIKRGKIFNIYFHPFDFLIQPSLDKYLEKLLKNISVERQHDNIHIMTMREIASYLDRNKSISLWASNKEIEKKRTFFKPGKYAYSHAYQISAKITDLLSKVK